MGSVLAVFCRAAVLANLARDSADAPKLTFVPQTLAANVQISD